MKLKVFGWLVVGCLLYVCPNALGQAFSMDIKGSLTSDSTIAGIAPGGAAWTVTSASVTISDAGKLKAKIKGLILPSTGTAGPVTGVQASLVCGGTIAASTASFPLSAAGDATIKGTITLPSRCVAPIVLIQVSAATGAGTIPSGAGPFIALSGFTTSSAADVRKADEPEQ
jgi:hypothetical protein